MVQSHFFDELPLQNRQALQRIFDGTDLPPLYSDTIAKRVFSADVHPDRLNFLLQNIAKDNTIDVRSGASNESWRQSANSKGMVSDIPSWLRDGRLSDLEIQSAAQNFIFTRIELYASSMLLLQYSVSRGETKSSLSYRNVREVLLVVLMVKSPRAFRDHDQNSDKYIHRFTTMASDTGLSYPSRAKMIYVQLDKCLAQFRNNFNAEAEDGHPDRLQKWLAMIADVNDPVIAETAADDETLTRIRTEIRSMAQDKEVQNMLTQEMFERMDWASYGEEREEEGIEKGIAKGIAKGMEKGMEKGENKLADLLKKLTPGSADFDKALNATSAERKELYKKYGIADN